MNIETVSIDSLSPDPANARRHGQRNLSAIAGSLRRFGQQKPIVVDSQNVVRAGNGTLKAARSLGWKEIGIVRSDLPAPELTAFAIADNRTAELAEWDAEVLEALSDQIDLGELGFDDDELEKMLSQDAVEEVDEQPMVGESFEVVVECRDEAEQKSVYERLKGEGLSCRLFTL